MQLTHLVQHHIRHKVEREDVCVQHCIALLVTRVSYYLSKGPILRAAS